MATVENMDFFAAWQFVPKSPEEMLVFFFRCRRADWKDFKIARIHIGRQSLNRAALSRCIPALKDDKRPAFVQDMQRLLLSQLFLKISQIVGIITVIFFACFKVR